MFKLTQPHMRTARRAEVGAIVHVFLLVYL